MSTALVQFTDEEKELIRTQVAPDATDTELALFLYHAQQAGLNPLAKQIYAIHRKSHGVPKMTIQISIDGFRLIAERSGQYGGQTEPLWADANGQWYDVWLQQFPPAAAKVGVYRTGWEKPLYKVATWAEFAGTTHFWKRLPSQMLAKVAESQALRAAFPQELSGLYTSEEMDQAGVIEVTPEIEFQSAGGTPTAVDHVDALVDHAVEMGAAVKTHEGWVDQAVEPTPAVDGGVALQRKTEYDSCLALAKAMYDEPELYLQKVVEHFGVSRWVTLDDAQVKEVTASLLDRRKHVIGNTRLKALHARGNEVEKMMVEAGDDWEWETQRHIYINQLTEGRTESSSKIMFKEWKSIMDWMEEMLQDESPFEGDGDAQ